MNTMRLATKAQTLRMLEPHLRRGRILKPFIFTVADWQKDAEALLGNISSTFPNSSLIVRSSRLIEDSTENSHAGAFTSLGSVASSNKGDLRNAIDAVVKSYGNAHPGDEVLIQKHLQDIRMCGVLFTCDLATHAPYFIVNYDDVSKSHDSVTSGQGKDLKTFVRFRGSPCPTQTPELAQLFECADELIRLFGNEKLDIEFAFSSETQPYIFQVRAITTKPGHSSLTISDGREYLNRIYQKVKKLNAPHPGIHGNKAIYSIMTDWNPAEMIGVKPKQLAVSLYKELITDSIWAYQRDNYGYQNVRSFPLLISFLGCPYIDVRASFNSFVPKELDAQLTGKLVDYYISKLRAHPSDHDKAEFRIVYSCYYLNIVERLKELTNQGFSELELDRIKFALLNLTNKIIAPASPLRKNDKERINTLQDRFKTLLEAKLPVIDTIYWLIEDTKRFGTLPFAGLARSGFIAVQMLNSLVDCGVFSIADRQQFMNSLDTVSSQLARDRQLLCSNKISKKQFLERYGHLRPGTYDICSKRYDEAFDNYFPSAVTQADIPAKSKQFKPSDKQLQRIDDLLRLNGLQTSAEELLTFIREGIEDREYAKFIFTKNVSYVLDLISALGAKHDLSRNDMSHVDLKTITQLYAGLTHEPLAVIFRRDIDLNRAQHQVCRQIKLPPLITEEDSIYEFFTQRVEPNFITQQKVTAQVVKEEEFGTKTIVGSIAFIKSADPGYDWVFARNISGLVTQYGGANSHMAIRCAELGIPAIIGCGDQYYSEWSTAQVLELDCLGHRVTILR